MKWLRENHFTFLIVPGISALGALCFLLQARANWGDAFSRFTQVSSELSRLERLSPYPSEENLRQMRMQADEYEAALIKLKDELKGRVHPCQPLAPNEFQSQLRSAVAAVMEKARARAVKFPDKFFLGFDEFTSALPSEAAAPLLGRELAQVEWILSVLIESGVDSLISFQRAPLPEERRAAATTSNPISRGQKPGATHLAATRLLERNTVEATFISTPAAARKVLNQIAGADRQFFIVRLLHIRNEQDKGPPREVEGDGNSRAMSSPVPVGARGKKSPAGAALDFIVGNERIETTATIEIVRFVPVNFVKRLPFFCSRVPAGRAGLAVNDIALGAAHRAAATGGALMVRIRAHYERVALLVAAIVLFCSATLIGRSVAQFDATFAVLPTAYPPKPALPPPKAAELESAILELRQPAQWTFSSRSGLFVPEMHFINAQGFPTTLRDTAVHPPVPNEWWEEFGLPLAETDVAIQDPDGDGFTNLEEWENHTNPTDKNSHPPFVAKLKMKSFAQEPFRLVFSSRIDQTFAINTNDLKAPTQFLRLGDRIRGTKLKLAGFNEKYEVNRSGTKIDVSELVLENLETRQQLDLVKERVMTSPESVANFVYLWGGHREFAVRKEQQFSLKPEEQIKYRLIDVQPVKAIIVNIQRPDEPIEVGLLNP